MEVAQGFGDQNPTERKFDEDEILLRRCGVMNLVHFGKACWTW